jgi:DNA polymerase-3 subunit delta
MRPADFFAAIEKSPLRPLYCFLGNDAYLREKATQCLLHLWGEEISRGINFEVYSAGSSSLAAIIDDACTVPFFGNKKVILVKDAGKIASHSEEVLLAYVKNPSPKTILIFTGDTIGLKNKHRPLLKKNGLVIECKQPYANAIPTWIQYMAQELGNSIKEAAVHLLQESVGNRLQDIANELEKLSLYVGEGKEITREAIGKAVSSLRVESIFELTDRVGSGKVPEALIALSQLMKSGEPPLKILAMITRQFRLLTKARSCLDQGMKQEKIKGALHVQDFIWRKLSPQANRFSREKLEKCYQLLLNADMGLKSRAISQKIILERLIMDLCA